MRNGTLKKSTGRVEGEYPGRHTCRRDVGGALAFLPDIAMLGHVVSFPSAATIFFSSCSWIAGTLEFPGVTTYCRHWS